MSFVPRTRAGYTGAVDWWSLGIVCFEMLFGFPPFHDRDFHKMCSNILKKPLRFPLLPSTGKGERVREGGRRRLPVEARAFLKGLLERNPSRRLGFINPHAAAAAAASPPSPPSPPPPPKIYKENNKMDIKAHPFFHGIDWGMLESGEIPPPQLLPQEDKRVEDVRYDSRFF